MKALFIKDWKLLKNQGKMDTFLLIRDNTVGGRCDQRLGTYLRLRG